MMSEEKLPITTNLDTIDLKIQLEQLQKELTSVTHKVTEFETLLYRHLGDQIVEVQELTILYKELKRAKKQKRQLQKQRGKNYTSPTSLKVVDEATQKTIEEDHSQEKKRLYREAMFHVHPDKFSLHPTETELATEVTTKLIQIYKEGDLKALQAYHSHIFSDASLTSLAGNANVQLQADAQAHLLSEIKTIREELDQIKNKSIYTVLTTYDNPYTFVDELKLYYSDRIEKLRKRTRKAFK